MSLLTNLQNLLTAIATDIKTHAAAIGALSSLTTTQKTSLVAAINEVKASIPTAGASINDTSTATTSTWSSSKTQQAITDAVNTLLNGAPGALDTLKELADAINDDAAFSATVTTALGNRVRIDTAAQGLTTTQQGNARTNIAAAAASDLSTLTSAVGDTTTDLAAAYATAKA